VTTRESESAPVVDADVDDREISVSFEILCGGALKVLGTLAEGMAQTCVTSPPYWGLRDYGTATWAGGDAACDHVAGEIRRGLGLAALGEQYRGGGHKQAKVSKLQYVGTCGKCGARRLDQQLGLERTPQEYIANIVEIFREVRRVLKDDGTLWLVLGDCYATGGGKVGNCPGGGAQGDRWKGFRGNHLVDSKRNPESIPLGPMTQPNRMPLPGFKPKDLVGIPWRVALALQADGWWLRSDIIWSKPNPMPESVRDRPTKAHEYVFLMAKQERYYYDADAIKEPGVADSLARYGRGRSTTHKWANGGPGNQTIAKSFAHMEKAGSGMRNKRTVWTIATCPTPEAHFATYPIELAELCILAGCPAGGVVLDPFSGVATTGLAALKHGRRYLGIELNPKYVEMSHRRAQKYYPLLAEGPAFDGEASAVRKFLSTGKFS
jgi:DNA modification methylase